MALRLSKVTKEEAVAVDSRLRWYMSAHTKVQRFVGHGLARLYDKDGLLDLCYSTKRDHVRERLGISVREAQELVHFERLLQTYRFTADVWLGGRINRCHVREILARVPLEEEGGWAHRAKGMTVRELRAALALAGFPTKKTVSGDDERGRWLDFTTTPPVRESFDLMAELVNRHYETNVGATGALEACCIEFQSGVALDLLEALDALGPRLTQEELERLRINECQAIDAMERACEKANACWKTLSQAWPNSVIPVFTLSEDATSVDIDASLREAIRFGQETDGFFMRTISLAVDCGLPEVLGFRSAEHYAQERLGLSASEVWRCARVGRQLRCCGAVDAAYRDGELSKSQAAEVVRIVTPATAHEWIRYARGRTVRELRRVVGAAVRLRKESTNVRAGILPPADRVLSNPDAEAFRDKQLSHLGPAGDDVATPGDVEEFPGVPRVPQDAGTDSALSRFAARTRRQRRSRRSEGAHAGSAEVDAELPACAQPPPDPGEELPACALSGDCAQAGSPPPTHPLRQRVWVPQELEAQVQDTLALCRLWFGNPVTTGTCIELMLQGFLAEYEHEAKELCREHRIETRDSWRCTAPGCTQMVRLHKHHLQFQSNGGGDEDTNITTLCAFHHLKALHEGRMHAVGTAPHDIVFVMGVQSDGQPMEVYEGDKRVWSRAA